MKRTAQHTGDPARVRARRPFARVATTVAVLACACSEPSRFEGQTSSGFRTASATAAPDQEARLEVWTRQLKSLRVDKLDSRLAVEAHDVPLTSMLTPGAPTVVAFWATYCPPCLLELPELEQISIKGHAVVGLSMDAGAVARAVEALEHARIRFPNAVLTDAGVREVGAVLDRGIPFTVVTDRCGRAAELLLGSSHRARLLDALARARERPCGL